MTIFLLQVAAQASLLGSGNHHHHHHDHEVAKKPDIIIGKTTSPNFKLMILKGSGKKLRNGRKRKPKTIRNKSNRPFPFRIPKTSFRCKGRAPGYYADVEADCQVNLKPWGRSEQWVTLMEALIVTCSSQCPNRLPKFTQKGIDIHINEAPSLCFLGIYVCSLIALGGNTKYLPCRQAIWPS